MKTRTNQFTQRRCVREFLTLSRSTILGVLSGIFILGLASPLYAQSQPEPEIQIKPNMPTERQAELDRLFADFKAAQTEDEAERLSNIIYSRFQQSGSDTLDLLAKRARAAMEKGEMPIAIEIMSRVIALDPSWAEAWNLRATAFFMMGDQERAQADVIATLAREPRHFGALTGMALMYEMEGRRKDALKVYRQALLLAPQLKQVKSAVERLAKELEQPM